MKGSTFIKRFVALLLVVLMSIDTLAAVVGDNDGAAFITKAEFDSMKNNFQSQLDRYNSSIDNKIDGAIASYLAGISVKKESSEKLFVNGQTSYTMVPDVSLPVYEYGRIGLDFKINIRRFMYLSSTGFDDLAKAFADKGRFQRFVRGETAGSGYVYPNLRFDLRWMHCHGHWTCQPTYSKKVVLSDFYNNGSEYRGTWAFYSPETEETIISVRNQMNDNSGPGGADHAVYPIVAVTTSYNPSFETRNDFLLSGFYSNDYDSGETGNVEAISNAATHTYNVKKHPNLLLFDGGNTSCNFSLLNSNHYLLTKNDTAFTESRANWAAHVNIESLVSRQAAIFLNGVSQADYDAGKYGQWDIYGAQYKTYPTEVLAIPATSVCAVPQFGFIPNVTKWAQVDASNISNIEYKHPSGTSLEAKWPLYYGFPLAQAENGARIKYHITFDTADTYNVYLKYGVFSGTPVDNDCISCSWTDSTGTHSGKTITIVGKEANISFDCDNTDIVCMKWRRTGSNDYATIDLTGDSAYYTLIK